MRKEEKAALDVLAKASDVHNRWAILDDAVASGEDDQFTKEYIEGEREMLEGSIKRMIRALGTLGGHYGIDAKTGNGSHAYMRKSREEHLTELERAKEFDRGYRAGQRSMDAERQSIALKLRGLTFDGSSHENLVRIAYAIYPCATGWTADSCKGLRDKLLRLLGGVNEREATLTTCDILDNERHNAVRELRKVCTELDESIWTWIEDVAIAIGAQDKQSDGYESMLPKITCRLIHLLGGDVCEGGDDGDCAERRRAGAAGGDTDVDEPSEIRAVSNEIADMLRSEMDTGSYRGVTIHLDGLSTYDELGNERHKAIAKLRRIVDEGKPITMRELADAIGMNLCIGDRVSFPICMRLIHLLGGDQPSGIDVLREMDAELSELMANNGELAAKCDELQAKLDKANGENKGLRLSIDEQKESIAQRKKTIKKLTRDNKKAWKNVHELQNERDYLTAALDDMQADPANDRICKLERERDELKAKLDGIAGVLDG